jgi:hypothetical protein
MTAGAIRWAQTESECGGLTRIGGWNLLAAGEQAELRRRAPPRAQALGPTGFRVWKQRLGLGSEPFRVVARPGVSQLRERPITGEANGIKDLRSSSSRSDSGVDASAVFTPL